MKELNQSLGSRQEVVVSADGHDSFLYSSSNIVMRIEEHRDLVSPKVWIPLSLLAALMNSVSNEIKSKIAAYITLLYFK